MRSNVLGMNANPPRGWIPIFGRTADENDDLDYQSAIEAALINGGHVYLYKVGGGTATIKLSRALTYAQSNCTLELGAGVTLDAQSLSVPCITATSKSNIRLCGDGKIVWRPSDAGDSG